MDRGVLEPAWSQVSRSQATQPEAPATDPGRGRLSVPSPLRPPRRTAHNAARNPPSPAHSAGTGRPPTLRTAIPIAPATGGVTAPARRFRGVLLPRPRPGRRRSSALPAPRPTLQVPALVALDPRADGHDPARRRADRSAEPHPAPHRGPAGKVGGVRGEKAFGGPTLIPESTTATCGSACRRDRPGG